jgi:hypothetical protein
MTMPGFIFHLVDGTAFRLNNSLYFGIVYLLFFMYFLSAGGQSIILRFTVISTRCVSFLLAAYEEDRMATKSALKRESISDGATTDIYDR